MNALKSFVALVVVMLLVAAGCDRGETGAPASAGKARGDGPINIVCTVGMVGDIVQAVAGDKAKVSNIIGQGVDPHLYKPTRDDMAKMSQAEMIFYSGLMLEGKMADSLVRMASSRPVTAVTEQIDPEYLLEPDGMEGHADPHVWMDVQAWSKAVDVVADRLADFDSANAETYRTNASAYKEQLAALDAYGKRIIATVPEGQRVLITSHDAFNYFGRAYGLDVQGVQGINTESEAALSHINQLVDFVVNNEVKAVFVETTVNPKNIRAVIEGARGRGHELKIGGELFSDAMGKPGTYEGTYIGMLDHNLTVVARALGGEAPADGLNGKLSHE